MGGNSVKFAVLDYVSASRNESARRRYAKNAAFRRNVPVLAWSEDDDDNEFYAKYFELPVHIYYFPGPFMSRSRFRFITGDRVHLTVPSLLIYIQPFHPSVWLVAAWSVVFIVAILIAIATKTRPKQRENFTKALQSSLLWIWGAVLDQVDGFVVGRRASRLVTSLLVFVLYMAFVLNNLYRAIC